MRILRATEYRRMPWKNGGGETREIVVYPAGATLETLDWRMSLATVASDGPFSVFSGIQRTLCVIGGAGIRLQVGEGLPAILLDSSAPFAFDGEAPSSATLLAGAIVDLNVITRRGRWRHVVKRLTLEGSVHVDATADVLIVFCQHGASLCIAGEESGRLTSEDCAVIDGIAPPIYLRAAEPAAVLIIELYRESRAGQA